MKLEEIEKLSVLARIDINKEEMVGLAKDFDSILAYVDQIQEVAKLIPVDSQQEKKSNSHLPFNNILREDSITENPQKYSDKIIKEMPDKEGRFLKVKQIL